MLLNIGIILSTGTAFLPTKLNLKENSKKSFAQNGDQLIISSRTSQLRLLQTLDLAGLGLQKIKMISPFLTLPTREIL